ncbi:MAG: thymidine phosphorylase [Rhodobacteraceae bacterium]|nr:thymidine phosphorylase [Paracoccaceae bacterium]
MDARSIIQRLRDKERLTRSELRWFADGLASGAVSDAQAGAFAMAACLNGMSESERVGLTLAMRDSGDRMEWDLPAPVVDKHSTGGLGDAVSLLLAPALAVCGVYVPMISGRGLGHTGGTLDKLEAIPGVNVDLTETRFRDLVQRLGCAIVSASGNLAPADKRLYAVRDVTSTVESIDLITASILSKKLAAGLEGLVLDVKVGSGAFMQRSEDALALAKALVSTANGAGCKTNALITDMNQPLADAVGNAVEVGAVMAALTSGRTDGPLEELSIALCAEILVTSGAEDDRDAARVKVSNALSSGAAAERFGQMIAEIGGPSDFTERWRNRLPEAPVIREVKAPQAGYLCGIDGYALGMAVVHLGGGRLRGSDLVDPSVGLSSVARLGDKLEPGAPVCFLHASDEARADAAEKAVLATLSFSDKAPEPLPLIKRSVP